MLATAFESQFEVLCGNLLLDIQEIASSVWDKCFELGGRIVVAKNDAENALHGENDAILMVMRLYGFEKDCVADAGAEPDMGFGRGGGGA